MVVHDGYGGPTNTHQHVFGALFGLGKLVLGEPVPAAGLLLLAVAGGVVVTREFRRGSPKGTE